MSGGARAGLRLSAVAALLSPVFVVSVPVACWVVSGWAAGWGAGGVRVRVWGRWGWCVVAFWTVPRSSLLIFCSVYGDARAPGKGLGRGILKSPDLPYSPRGKPEVVVVVVVVTRYCYRID